MGRANDGKASILEAFGITPLLTIGQGIADIGEVLMAIGTNKLVVLLSVEVETILAFELERTDADAGNAAVERLLAVFNAGDYII